MTLRNTVDAIGATLAGLPLIDLILTGGHWVTEIGFAVVSVIFGSPEILVGLFSALRALSSFELFGFLPQGLIEGALVASLAFLAGTFAVRFVTRVLSKT